VIICGSRFDIKMDSLLIANINSLPCLEVGVTHSKGGSMEKLIKRVSKAEKDVSSEDKSGIICKHLKQEMVLLLKMNENFDRYADEITENGAAVEQIHLQNEATSDVVYVVTSIRWVGDPFLPKCHGIFTTCSKAQAAAKKVFEAVSVSYRDGKFLPNDERISKCDVTEYLIPGIEFSCRPLFERFEDHCAVVAINAVQIDTNVEDDLPFLSNWYYTYNEQSKKWANHRHRNEDSTIDVHLGGGAKVYAIFEFGPQMHYSYGDISLCGVYQKRKKALSRGKDFTDFHMIEEEDSEDEDDSNDWRKKEIDQQLARAEDVTNGLLFDGGEDIPWAVALETVLLDQLNLDAQQIDLDQMRFHDVEDVAFF